MGASAAHKHNNSFWLLTSSSPFWEEGRAEGVLETP